MFGPSVLALSSMPAELDKSFVYLQPIPADPDQHLMAIAQITSARTYTAQYSATRTECMPEQET
jgi:hypothetical protein